MIRKPIKTFIIGLIGVLIAFKLFAFNASIIQPNIIGEYSGGKFSDACISNNYEIINKVYINDIDICSVYKGRYVLRGFYMHHYGSFTKSLHKDGYNLVANMLKDQYGLGSAIGINILQQSGVTIKPSTMYQFSLLAFIGIYLIIAKILKLNYSETFSTLFIVTLLCTQLDAYQALLSPGFNPLRFLPSFIIVLILSHEENRKYIQGRILPTIIICASIIINSFSFNILALASCLASWTFKNIYNITRKNSARKYGSEYIIVITILSMILLSFALGIDLREYFASATDKSISERAFLQVIILTYLTFILWGNSYSLHSHHKYTNTIWTLLDPLTRTSFWLVISYSTYYTNFVGSPNHIIGYFLIISGSLGGIANDIINFRYNKHTKYEFKKIIQIRRNSILLILNSINSWMILDKNPLIRMLSKRRRIKRSKRQRILRSFLLIYVIAYAFYGQLILGFANKTRLVILKDWSNLKKEDSFAFCKDQPIEIGPFQLNNCEGNFNALHKVSINNVLYLSDKSALRNSDGFAGAEWSLQFYETSTEEITKRWNRILKNNKLKCTKDNLKISNNICTKAVKEAVDEFIVFKEVEKEINKLKMNKANIVFDKELEMIEEVILLINLIPASEVDSDEYLASKEIFKKAERAMSRLYVYFLLQ